jgi:Xaa-Pro aminopeptidase
MFPDFDYSARIEKARAAMVDAGVDVLLLSLGADLPYLSGYEAPATERLTMLVVPSDGEATLFVPVLEAPRVVPRGDAFTIRPWAETEDPVTLVAGSAGAAATAALGDRAWAGFLLRLQEQMPATRFTSATPVMTEMRIRKDPAEVGFLRSAAEATDRVVVRLGETRFAGRTERELSAEVRAMCLEEGHDEATFASVGSGPNGASPHHDASDRVIEEGDAVVIDFGGRWRGYCSDTTRTFHVGEPPAPVAEAYEALRAAQDAGRAAVAPRVPAQEVDRVTRKVIDTAGYGEWFIHRTGHGIGLEVHEHPYLVEGNSMPLEEGMTFSIEPGIYLPGEFGMRIEDIVAVSGNGIDELNDSDRSLHIVS